MQIRADGEGYGCVQTAKLLFPFLTTIFLKAKTSDLKQQGFSSQLLFFHKNPGIVYDIGLEMPFY